MKDITHNQAMAQTLTESKKKIEELKKEKDKTLSLLESNKLELEKKIGLE